MKNWMQPSWLLTGLAIAVATAYAVVLALGPPNMTAAVLDFAAKIIGPLGAALIAWAGVSHTVMNSRRMEEFKQWHLDLHWASELCASSDPLKAGIGIAVLDELDDYPGLGPEQAKMVDAITKTVIETAEVDDEI